MSIPLTPEHLIHVAALPQRAAVLSLLIDPTGPLGDCAACPEEAPAAYLLAVLYRHSRHGGILHGKPGREAEELFANRVRSTIRRALNPFAWGVMLARAVGVRWEALSEDDRLWWRGAAHQLGAGADGVSPLSDWSRLKQPQRVADLLTSAMIASDWIGQIRGKEAT